MNIECPDQIRKTQAELLNELRTDNLRLVRENLVLRHRLIRVLRAFGKFGQKVRGKYKAEKWWLE